jgi:site-specific DNA recombinase
MLVNVPLIARNSDGIVRAISVGRLSKPKETEEETKESLESMRAENERFLKTIFPGPTITRYLGEQISGLVAERETMLELWDLVRTGDWDVVIAEDLSRIFRNPRFQWAFVQDAFDAEVRVICFADHLDTADESWETPMACASLRHGLAIPDTRRRIKRQATTAFHRGGMVLKVKFGFAKVSREDAKAGTFGSKELRMRRLEECTPVFDEIRRRFGDGQSPLAVVSWLNSEGIPCGPYVRSGHWSRILLQRLLEDPLLHGPRVFRRKLNRPIYRTGKYRRETNPTPETENVPELAHMTRDQQEAMLACVGWRIDWGGAPPPKTRNPRLGISRFQSLWPGQSATCAACDGAMYAVGKCLKCRNSLAAVDQTCWNHVQAPIAELRAFVTNWLVEQFHASDEFRNILLEAAREQLRQQQSRQTANRDRQEAEIIALQTRESNLRKSIGIAKKLTDEQLESLVGDLAAVTEQLMKKRKQATSAEPSDETLGDLSDEEIAERLSEVLAHLMDTSYEMAEVIRGFVPRCVIVPVQAIDSGQVHPRAKLLVRDVGLSQSIPEAASLRELTVDLFQPPVHIAMLREVVPLRSKQPQPTLKQIGQALGINYMTVKRALGVAKQMEAQGLTDPLIELAAKPAYASRWKDAP